MSRVIYVSVNSKHYLMTIYTYYIYQMNGTYVKVVNQFIFLFSLAIS